MHERRILLLVYGTFQITTRAYEIGRTLKKAGYSIVVIGATREALPVTYPTKEQLDAIDISHVPLLTQVGPLTIIRLLLQLVRGDIGQKTQPMPTGRAPLRTLLNIFFFNLWVIRLGGKLKPDAIFCYGIPPLASAWGIAKRLHIPMVYDAAEGIFTIPTNLQERIQARSERIFAPRATAVVTVGERLKADLTAMGCKQVEIIGNWKRLEIYNPLGYDLITERQRLNIPEDQLIVSYIGLLFKHREIEPLLSAVAAMSDVHLVISGRGDLAEMVQEMARKAPNIHWLGWVEQDDLPRYAALSDVIYCCLSADAPTMYYAMPNKLFEALAAGRTILATRGVGEMSDFIEQTGCGYLVDAATPEALTEALSNLQDENRRKTIETAARKAGATYNWAVAEERLLKRYQDLIGLAQP